MVVPDRHFQFQIHVPAKTFYPRAFLLYSNIQSQVPKKFRSKRFLQIFFTSSTKFLKTFFLYQEIQNAFICATYIYTQNSTLLCPSKLYAISKPNSNQIQKKSLFLRVTLKNYIRVGNQTTVFRRNLGFYNDSRPRLDFYRNRADFQLRDKLYPHCRCQEFFKKSCC